MTDYAALRADPLAHLDYFTEWGGPVWERFVRVGLVDYLGTGLAGQRVLEIGSRYGKMSCLFGLLGAQVTGVDLHEKHVEMARREAHEFGVDENVEFIQDRGDLQAIDRTFDIIFSKSVLVLVPDMQGLLRRADQLLKPGGRIVFIENGRGNWLLRMARWWKHRGRWDYSQVNFFDTGRIELVKSIFKLERIEKSRIPPVYLFCGRKNGSEG